MKKKRESFRQPWTYNSEMFQDFIIGSIRFKSDGTSQTISSTKGIANEFPDNFPNDKSYWKNLKNW